MAAFLTVKFAQTGKTNIELASEIGYERPNVIAMLKTGAMRLPVNRVHATAKAIDVDPVFLLRKVLLESAPEIWDGIYAVLGDRMVTDNEMKLINAIRKLQDEQDIDLTKQPEFMDAIKPVVKSIAKTEAAKDKGTLERVQREKDKRAAGAR
jgi:hypothetical protein